MKRLRLPAATVGVLLLLGFTPAIAASGRLPTYGGPVMHHPTIYTIFWIPPGYHFHTPDSALSDGDFEDAQMQFLSDLSGSDYYGVLTQYRDRTGAVGDSFDLPDPVIDTNPYPGSRGTVATPLVHSDINTEVQRVARADGLKNVPGETIYLVYTPLGVQACTADLKTCSMSPLRPKGSYIPECAYHTYFTSQKKRWVDALVTVEGLVCHSWQRSITDQTAPNSDAVSDLATSSVGHEIAEAVTDPYFNTWIAANGTEVGDRCSGVAGPLDAFGGDVQLGYNSYYIQTLWSNVDRACVMALGG